MAWAQEIIDFVLKSKPWTTVNEYYTATANYINLSFYQRDASDEGNTTVDDKIYIDDVSVKPVPYYTTNGTHSADTSTTEKQAGSYSDVFVSTNVGDSTTNHVSLDTLYFTELVPGDYLRFGSYVKSGTASTTMYIRIGNNTQTFALTADWALYNYDILVNSYTVKKKIKIWFDKAATVYFDTGSIKKAM